MKKNHLLMGIILLIFPIIASFVLYPITTRGADNRQNFYLRGTLTLNDYPKFRVPITNALNKGDGATILKDPIKLQYTVLDGSILFNAAKNNGFNEVGVGVDPNPECGMFVKLTGLNTVIEEADIFINSNFGSPEAWDYNNSNYTKFDMGTAARHEVGHVQGIDHTPFDLGYLQRNQWLMYDKSLQGGRVRGYDADYINAIECIYKNDCSQIIVTGSISFDYEIKELCDSDQYEVNWTFNENESSVVGFNLIQILEAKKFTSINKTLIPYTMTNEYKFILEKNIEDNLQLEIVYNNGMRGYKELK